ncbi:hypothetical protein AJ78_03647 [Emergomyces pasteurianus Ep9510]|uniref:Uncharacterized protein n=1 Tax=Emergomyces pasteurianus Ep9510 TaxID=1447872 RepID=A0A1J9PJE4_9EURO|nr:hypothetical protein AJ78_03647 [Emergomyces pasteurianus Ep9510]
MAPKYISKAKRGKKSSQGGHPEGLKREITADPLQQQVFSPSSVGNTGPAPSPAKTQLAAMQSSYILERAQGPKVYYPKVKNAIDETPNSAPLLPRGYSYSDMTKQQFKTVRKVSSTPGLRGGEALFGRNQVTDQTSTSPASSEKSAETPQEDYCQPLPKLEGIILGSPGLSLTSKGTCGTRGSGKLIVPERKASNAQGSIKIEDSEEYVYLSSGTETRRPTPSKNDPEISLPGQNLGLSSSQLPPQPHTPVESGQCSQSQGASSHNSSFSHARSISRARGERDSSSNPAISNISRTQGAPLFVQTPINSLHAHSMAPETSPDQDPNVAEQFDPAVEPGKTVSQVVLADETPQNEILSQLKSLAESVIGINIEQTKINKKLEDTNNHLQALSEELQLEKHTRFWNLAAYEKSINNHITQVVGSLGEAVESVAVTVAKIRDKTAKIGSDDLEANEGDDVKWSDLAEQETSDTFARAPVTTYRAPLDQGHGRPSTVQNTGGRRGSDGDKVNIGSPIRKADAPANPSVAEDTSPEQGQPQVGGWRDPSTTQKRGFWSHKRHNGGMSRRGSAGGNKNRKSAIPNFAEQHPSMAVAPEVQELAASSSYSHTHMHGGYEGQPYNHHAIRDPGPSISYGHASGQHRGFPPRQSSLRHNHNYMRGGGGLSTRNYAPHRDFSPNYGSPSPLLGQGQPQPGHPQFQTTQNIGNTPPVGQWPAAHAEFNVYRPWAGVSNWYHQVNPQRNINMQSPPN